MKIQISECTISYKDHDRVFLTYRLSLHCNSSTVRPKFTGMIGGKGFCPVNRGSGKSGSDCIAMLADSRTAKRQNARRANLYYLQQTCPVPILSTLTLKLDKIPKTFLSYFQKHFSLMDRYHKYSINQPYKLKYSRTPIYRAPIYRNPDLPGGTLSPRSSRR
eukprot:sb/3472725/